jgi:uncharacterized ferredoxin-like protein
LAIAVGNDVGQAKYLVFAPRVWYFGGIALAVDLSTVKAGVGMKIAAMQRYGQRCENEKLCS